MKERFVDGKDPDIGKFIKFKNHLIPTCQNFTKVQMNIIFCVDYENEEKYPDKEADDDLTSNWFEDEEESQSSELKSKNSEILKTDESEEDDYMTMDLSAFA